MGGLSMLLLAGERALSAREVSSSTSPVTADADKHSGKSALFQLAEISSNSLRSGAADASKDAGSCVLFQLAEISSSSPQSNTAPPTPSEGKSLAAEPAAVGSETPSLGSSSPSGDAEKSALFQLAEISSSSSQSTDGKQCGQSALFQLAEMCLASEAVKIEALGSQPSQPSSSCSSAELDSREATCNSQDARDLSLSSPSSSSSSSSTSSSSSSSTTPMDGSPPALGQSKAVKKKKKKKKDKSEEGKADKSPPSLKKPCKRRQSSESDLESVIYTIEAVAKGAWGSDRAQKRKSRPPSSDKGDSEEPGSPKKKVKAKVKKVAQAKEDEGSAGECKTPEEELPLTCPETETKDVGVKAEPQVSGEEPSPPSTPAPPVLPVKAEEKDGEGKSESCGSRKSERSCKGALYKTLVSEGMLTSLRANVDRGKRGSGRGSVSDLEGSWTEESWTFTQTGPSSTKKLKKSRWKDEALPGLGKLEEEFEKKFNSLPQYSPLTFDKKNTSVTKKKKMGVEQPKGTRGSSSSQKKNLFHKIVSKYKHKKEKTNTLDKAIVTQDTHPLDTAQKAKLSVPGAVSPLDTMGAAEMLVGSQKRKARKSKITHLVRTADGRVSPAEAEDKAKELTQDQDEKPSTQETLCNESGHYEGPKPQEACEAAAVSDLPAFFSLAALAEVAAMENAHRSQRTVGMPGEGQSKEMAQTPVLISCADQ